MSVRWLSTLMNAPYKRNRDFIRTLDERIAGSVSGAHTLTTFRDMGYWGR